MDIILLKGSITMDFNIINTTMQLIEYQVK
jgi:hypothetical protein